MPLRMWMYDLAREQNPTVEHWRRFLDTTVAGGFDSFGIYLEHRYAYPSSKSVGKGALTPATVAQLEAEYPQIRIVPFVNLLGHFEGFLYTEPYKSLAEEPFKGLQACPCNEEFKDLALALLDDVIEGFRSDLIHIGGDETKQLGKCPRCSQIPKEELFGKHFGGAARRVLEKGRRPAIWGDMLLEHPEAASYLPKETLVFNWQYFESPSETTSKLRQMGFEVVNCPTLHVYNSVWMHLRESEENVKAHAAEPSDGLCLTTWEGALFGNYETLLPAIRASGRIFNGESTGFLDSYREESADTLDWVEKIGMELPQFGGPFGFSQTRSSLKVRLLLQSNPFLAWRYHREELQGELGARAFRLADQASTFAPNSDYRGVSDFIKSVIEFVGHADEAQKAYALADPGAAANALMPCRQIFDNLMRIGKANHLNAGGSLADIERSRIAKEQVERVIMRIKAYGGGSLGYLPSFEHITHQNFVPHDQGAWWRINDWARD